MRTINVVALAVVFCVCLWSCVTRYPIVYASQTAPYKAGEKHLNEGFNLLDSDPAKAIKILSQAETEYIESTKLGFREPEDAWERVALVRGNMGFAYSKLGDLETAYEKYLSGHQAYEAHNIPLSSRREFIYIALAQIAPDSRAAWGKKAAEINAAVAKWRHEADEEWKRRQGEQAEEAARRDTEARQQSANAGTSTQNDLRSGSCPRNLRHIEYQLPFYADAQLMAIRENLLNTDMLAVLQQARAQGYSPAAAAKAALDQSAEFEKGLKPAQGCIRAINADHERIINALETGGFSLVKLEQGGLTQACTSAYVAYRYGRVAARETAVILTCLARENP